MPSPNHHNKPNDRSESAAPGSRPNSLGLSSKDLDRVLDDLDAADDANDAARSKRKFVRRRFRQSTCRMTIHQPTGSSSSFTVACRNVSRDGACIIHRAFVHPGCRCTIELNLAEGGTREVHGKIVHCVHRVGMVHQVGVRFEQPISIRDFVPLRLFTDWFSLETVNPEDLKGSVLYIDDCASDRELIRFHLRDTNLVVTTADNPLEGLERAGEGFDLILTDLYMDDMDGNTLVDQLRQRGIRTPVVMLTADESAAVQGGIIGVDAQAFLSKPVNPLLLLRAIGEFLLVRRDEEAEQQSRAGVPFDGNGAELLSNFQDMLEGTADKLQRAMELEEPDGVRRLCLQVKGAAAAMAVRALAQQAERTLKQLAATASVVESKFEIERLILACHQAMRRRAG